MKIPVRAAALLAAILFVPSVPQASTRVIGGGAATDCSIEALAGRHDNDVLHICDLALEGQILERSDRAKTFVNRAVVYFWRNNHRAAERDLASAERLMPQLPEVYINRGALWVKQRRFAEAVAEIDRGLALGPIEPEKAYFNRALARQGMSDIRGAYLDFRRASLLKPGWAPAQRQLARYTSAAAR